MAFFRYFVFGCLCCLSSFGRLDAAGAPAAAPAAAAAKEHGLDAAQRTKIMDDHNTFRGTLPAADMARIAWWAEGASTANNLTDACNATLETDTGHVALMSTAADFKPETYVDEVKKQQAAYNDLTNRCLNNKKCEDYRQLIVGSNNKVGCAVKACAAGKFTKADGTAEAKAVQFVVCLYPKKADDRVSKHQYTKGTHCTKCSTISPGLWCKDKLCTPKDKCTDDIIVCPSVDEAKCKADAETRKKCPVKCKVCGCKLECENCGKRSSKGCGCDCIPGYHGGICKNKCENHSTTCTASTVHACQLYSKKREMCPVLCGLCKYDPNPVCKKPPGPISLNQKAAHNAMMDFGRNIDCRTQIWCIKGWPYLEGSTCKCRCQEGWQGTLCNKNTNQAENGVVLTIQGKKDKYSVIQKKLRQLIANEMNRYCKANMDICCPFERSSKSLPNNPTYTHIERVLVGAGYPDFTKILKEGTFSLLIYALYEPDNTLCTAPGSKSRKKRSASEGCPVGFIRENDKCVYDVKVPRDIVYMALKDRRSEMNKDMVAGAVIDTVTLAAANVKSYVNHRADIKTVFYDWERALIILAIIMGGFMIWLILAIFYGNRKFRLKRQLAKEREGKKGDNFLMRMEQAKQAKIQQEKDARIAYEREMRRKDPTWEPEPVPVAAQAEVVYDPYQDPRYANSAYNGGFEHEPDCPQHRDYHEGPQSPRMAPRHDLYPPQSPHLARGSPQVARGSTRSDYRQPGNPQFAREGSTRSDYRPAPPHRQFAREGSTRSDYRGPPPGAQGGGEPYRPYANPQL